MQLTLNLLSAPQMLPAIGTYLCAVALFYLVVSRTLRNRQEQSDLDFAGASYA